MENNKCPDNINELKYPTVADEVQEEVEVTTKKSKKKIIIGVVFLLVIGILIAVSLQSTSLQALEDSITLEYGDELSDKVEDYLDLSSYSNNEIDSIQENATLDSPDITGVGEYTISIAYGEEIIDIHLDVVDTTAPAFIDVELLLNIEVYQGGQLEENFLDAYIVQDLSEVTITLDASNVDYSTTGEYIAYIVATDEYENETTIEITINILTGEIELEETSITLSESANYTIAPTFTGILSDEDEYTFQSDDKDIATVSDTGKITAKSEGTTTITISIKEVEKEIKVIVEDTVTSSSSGSSSSGSGSSSSSSSSSNNSSNNSSDEEEHSDAYLQYMEELEELTTPHISMEALDIINDYRVASGLSPMTYDSTLEGYALQRAIDVQTNFSHDGSYQNLQDGTWPKNTTEVLASVGSSNSYAAYVVEGWKGSSAHWNSLMGENKISAAVAYMNGKWVCVMFYDQG